MKRLIVAGLVLAPSLVSAHIHMTFPKSRTDSPTGDQKTEHCGVANYVRSAHLDRVSTFAPGATITVTWDETIQHPGYFRIAFQPDGEVFKIPAPGNGPPAGFPSMNEEGVDQGNGSIILADRITDGTLSKTITLPNMECANCTLQFIQVMTDKPPYTVDPGSDDIYFNCADITLAAGAPDAGPGSGSNPGGPDAGTTDPGNNNGGTVGGGCSTGSGSATALLGILGVLGLGLRRRYVTR